MSDKWEMGEKKQEELPLIAAFEKASFRDVGRIIKNLVKYCPRYLEGDSEQLGRLFCAMVYTANEE